jgi:ATP-dependent Clp protease ATP-binding subunit ClpA/ATP-dependent Clp protease ATP-binding subunit ClpC
VVLFDEIEKAHASVFPLFLQLFDDGRLTDASGYTADFTRAVVLMTSNLGATSQASLGFGDAALHRASAVKRALEEFFAPELLNRIDRVVPFEPLAHDTARRIATKELRALLGRWGLVERSISVTVTESAIERVVAEGFDPTYGARTVKRYLEDHVGSRLAAEITAAGPASMRILLIYARPDGFHVHAESLVEGEAAPAHYAIAPRLGLSPRDLQRLLPETLDQLDALLADESLAGLSREISEGVQRHNLGDAGYTDALHEMDALRHALQQLRRRVGYQRGTNAPDKAEILSHLAEVQFYRRALTLVRDPEQHAVFVKIQRIGLGQRPRAPREAESPGLLEALARVYTTRRAELEGVAARMPDGRTLAYDPGAAKELEGVLARRPDVLVLRLVGLCLLDFLGGENGCHVWRSLAGGAEILRVDVTPAGAGRTARAEVEAHREAARAFAAALEASDGALPPNPAGLRPTVREIAFDPPMAGAAALGAARPAEAAPLKLEDYRLGHAETTRARTLEEVLPRLLLLRMSRTEAP